MTLPTYDQLMLPLMKLLSEQQKAIKISVVAEMLALRSGLTEEELSTTLPSGKNIFRDRVSWAKTYLVKAGLVNQPQRAFCELSQLGRNIDLSKLNSITNEYLMDFEGFSDFKLGNSENLKTDNLHEQIKSIEKTQTPEEIIDKTSNILISSLKPELLNLIKNNSPQFFEKLVVDLLVAMGYGGSHQDAAKAIGKTNDGGIDGIISEDRLGLDKIYIQAKRWENIVHRPEIHKFLGALTDKKAKKGVFITTSDFSSGAKETAKNSDIVLINGELLTTLMIEFGLGVQIERSFHIYRIDQDRFDEESF
ncbi:restriction endonuclease [Acinetobacter gerneri]|uniref:Restriction endonuclease n=1 Tax=Acinetobacter gerneri DSM 14967 = CIP 107464 = MTCC 9824 TaxID=1120926 RepID=N8ZT99_9GAMM|nr:restriction endonuclease [Acinetobacter gerneri]ENV34710.1 hypothetical protein F960_01016 [Acinetobacter gerneri DSM 14967 = CIP 107464 = MTCC 9824]EPR84885.1 Mrr restriction system protein [Acinetobacter gerneri DSM 14967 = CIP 107464 = MTCC 9824]